MPDTTHPALDTRNGPGMKESHIFFLSTLAKLWPLTLEFKHLKEQKKSTDSLELEQQKIVDEAKLWQKRLLWLRALIYKLYQTSEHHFQHYNAKAAADTVWWIENFAMTTDPRLPPLGIDANVPFVLWPEQERLLKEFLSCYRQRLPFLVEKARETGITWTFIAFMCHRFLFEKGFNGTLASRDAGQVDDLGNINTLFGKFRHMLYFTPASMRPPELRARDNSFDKMMNISNPAIGSLIIGEAGDKIGRGGRSSMTFIDEAAHLEHPESVDSALNNNTNCQVDVSTPNGMNNFYRKRTGGGVTVFTMRWWKDPSKNTDFAKDSPPVANAWYQYQKEKTSHDPTIVPREIDINYNASVEGVFIPAEWVNAAVNFNLQPEGDNVAGFDVAAGGENEAVYTRRRGPVVMPCVPFKFKTSTEAIYAAWNQAEKDGICLMNYDHDGIGESVLGLATTTERKLKFKLRGIRGGAASSEAVDDEGVSDRSKYRNKRAELWDGVRQRFRKVYEHVNGIRFYAAGEMISIPNDALLISQLSSPKLKPTPSGKILIESKQDMKKRGIKSPDRADSLVYAFADYDDDLAVSTFDYTGANFSSFDVDHERSSSAFHYISLVQDKSLTVSAIVTLWWPYTKRLQVYAEYEQGNADADAVVKDLKDVSECSVKMVNEWIGNDEMFEEGMGTRPWFLFRKAGVSLKRNYNNDYLGGLMLANKMFASGSITVHKDCKGLMLQLANMKKGTELGLAKALCQLLTRLRNKKMLTEAEMDARLYNGSQGKFGNTSVVKPSFVNALNKLRTEVFDGGPGSR